MSINNRDRLTLMNNRDLAQFLFNVSEIGSSYFLNAVCVACVADCPPDDGCLYTPTNAIVKWLETEVE